jgi:hypothetical protein
MSTLTTQEMLEAAKMIEIDGADAFQTVSTRFGKDAAKLLLIALMRRNRGSMDSFPEPSSINEEVAADLQRLGIE